MPPKSYLYTKNEVGFASKIAGSCDVAPLSTQRTINGDLWILMPKALDADEKSNLDFHMNDRGYSQSATPMLLHGSVQVVTLGGPIGPAWTLLGGVVTNPAFFVPEVERVVGLLTCSIKTNGAGAKIRVLENDNGTITTLLEADLPDTGDAWVPFQIFTGNPTGGASQKTYTLEGDDGGIGAELRFCTLSIAEILQE